ncbi:MAG: hypothetical protein WBA99_19975 [Nodosilinea sp.]
MTGCPGLGQDINPVVSAREASTRRLWKRGSTEAKVDAGTEIGLDSLTLSRIWDPKALACVSSGGRNNSRLKPPTLKCNRYRFR